MEIRFDNVHKTYKGRSGPVVALDGINFSIHEGEFVSLVGPSGCGKSTLLNMLAGFDVPTTGSLLFGGEHVQGPSIERVMMFQDAGLFPWLNARENLAFGLKSQGIKAAERRDIAQKYLEMVNLAAFAEAQPHELSGGMRQRVALARSLAVDPKVLLMDEPFAALDAQTRELLQGELQNIWRTTRKTVLFVTHNVQEAVALSTRVLVFTARPGIIKREFDLSGLDFPRLPTQSRVAEMIAAIQHELRDEVAKVEHAELAGAI